MCGICGIVNFSESPVEPEKLRQMANAIAHRGPDDEGIWTDGNVGLASRRLAVMDISTNGHMPMCNEDRTLWITYNGEIYNFLEVRKKLIAKGHCFASHTDTETILHGYEEWGSTCVENFMGMFAFAIWDCRKMELFLARDRLGVKPLFYEWTDGRIIFCSELHPILMEKQLTIDDIDPIALNEFLAFGYVTPTRCFIKGLSKMPAGTTITINRHGFITHEYYHISVKEDQSLGYNDALVRTENLLETAVSRRLASDVPLGCFLSGGIDSGLVVALAARNSSRPISTFSVGFKNTTPDNDERIYARLVAQRYATDHHELEVDPHNIKSLPRLLYHFGEPFGDLSAIPTFQISMAAKQAITVALSGDGGDEAFAGYANIRASYLAQKINNVLPRPIICLIGQILQHRFVTIYPKAHSLRTLLNTYALQGPVEHYEIIDNWHSLERVKLLTIALYKDYDFVKKLVEKVSGLNLSLIDTYVDYHLRLPGSYLPKVDITSSAASLEIRSPFLDHVLVDFALTIPMRYKLRGGHQKHLLRELARKYLPREIISMPKKGFAPPVRQWLSTSWVYLLRGEIGQSLCRRDDLFDTRFLRNQIDEFLKGNHQLAPRLWLCICLELWIQLFIEKRLQAESELTE
jgi:asparagine synthase (glutamine-hydrolysing)